MEWFRRALHHYCGGETSLLLLLLSVLPFCFFMTVLSSLKVTFLRVLFHFYMCCVFFTSLALIGCLGDVPLPPAWCSVRCHSNSCWTRLINHTWLSRLLIFMLPVFSYMSIMPKVRRRRLFFVVGTQSLMRMKINWQTNGVAPGQTLTENPFGWWCLMAAVITRLLAELQICCHEINIYKDCSSASSSNPTNPVLVTSSSPWLSFKNGTNLQPHIFITFSWCADEFQHITSYLTLWPVW